MCKYRIYKVLYFCLFCIYFPYLLCKKYFQGKNVREFFQRLIPAKIVLPENKKEIIWAHAVSVGEVVAITPIILRLMQEKENVQIILSTMTDTGFETSKKMIPEAIHVRIPLDFTYSIRRLLGNIAPSLVLLSEGDVWPVFLHEMKKRKARIVLINGKISDRSFYWYEKFFSWGNWLYSSIDVFCAQSDRMKERWESLGIPSKNIYVTGNTKTEKPPKVLSQEECATLRTKFGVKDKDRVIVLGSSHYPEEEKLIEILSPLLKDDRLIKIIVVPRHPERACEVCEALQRKVAPEEVELVSSGKIESRILVVDELGVLISLYQIATVAIVCGSFIEKIGGHNIFESAVYGVPTIVGPYMHSQRTLFESALKNMAVMQIGYRDLPIVIRNLLRDDEVREGCSKKAKAWAESLRGAAEKTVQIILDQKK